MYDPPAGIWDAISDPGVTIEVYFPGQEAVFAIQVTLLAGGVSVTWDPTLFT